MKKIMLYLSLFITGINYGQTHQWATKISGTQSLIVAPEVKVSELIASTNGDIYMSGSFSGTVDFDASKTTVERTSLDKDGFVAAFDASGKLQWVYTTNVAGDEEVSAISFYNTVAYTISSVVKVGNNAFRIDRINRVDGQVLASSSTYTSTGSIDIKEMNAQGFLVGGFTGTLTLDSITLTSQGLMDGFCIKPTSIPTGYSIALAKSYGGVGDDIINSISETYMAGSFSETIDLNGFIRISNGGKDALFFKYNTSNLNALAGTYTKSIGGVGDDEITTIVDSFVSGGNYHNVVIGGYFSDTVNFTIRTGVNAVNITSTGLKDGFIANYNFLNSTSSYDNRGITKIGTLYNDLVADLSITNIDSRIYFCAKKENASGGSEVFIGSRDRSSGNGALTSFTGTFLPTNTSTVINPKAVVFLTNNIYYAGDFNGETDFNIDTTATSNVSVPSVGSSAFLQRTSFCTVSASAPTISGVSSVCLGEEALLSLSGNITDNATWNWYSDSCGGTYVGSGATLKVSPSTTTNYYVRAEGGCMPDGACSAVKTITVNPIPSDQVTLNDKTLMATETGATYQWVDCNDNNKNVATGQSFTPTLSGNYAVIVTKAGCSVTSTCTQVNLCDQASKPSIQGVNSVCFNENITLSIQNGLLNDSTEWKWYSGSCGGTLIGTGESIQVTPTATTDYFVRGEGGCVLNGECSDVKTITVNELPEVVTVSESEGILIASNSNMAGYQWIDCSTNQPIDDANSVSYAPTLQGNYAVKVTNTSGCYITSDCFTYATLSTDDIFNINSETTIYPNPVSDVFMIKNKLKVNRVLVYSLLGNLVKEFVGNESNVYNIDDLPNGIFLIKIVSETDSKTIKIIKK